MNNGKKLLRIEVGIKNVEAKIAKDPTSVKLPIWQRKLEDLYNDKKLLQSGKYPDISLDSHRTGITISPPAGGFNHKR